MIGPIEKGFDSAAMQRPPADSYEGINLSSLPNYISYKAALIKQKTTLKMVLAIVCVLFCAHYIGSRAESAIMQTKLREKEYILAPSVVDYTTVVPASVPSNYVNEAVSDFISSLGNVSPQSIQYQYASVMRHMDKKLKVKFEMETADWLKQVETENLSQVFSISEKEITSDKEGNYKAVVLGRADFYANHQYLGYENQVIDMQLRLTPPGNGKRWYLEIVTLQWEKADSFKTKKNLQNQPQLTEKSQTKEAK